MASNRAVLRFICGKVEAVALLPQACRDTAWAISEENVEAFKRAADATNRRDVEALLEEVDPEIEWHPGALMTPVEGEVKAYRGHEAVRQMMENLLETVAEFYVEYSEIRDLGDRIVAIGRLRMVGRGSGAKLESPFASLVDVRNGKAIQVRTYLDPKEALEAAGLSE
jgi:ketosteroid isomerase-like protein